jgi:predicted Ser/Thr protein kinase
MVGEKISHYVVEEELGQGGMGVVYRARDIRLNRSVALKMLLPELSSDAALRRRLANEARAASALNHPSVATIYDFEELGERAFIVYEYVRGSNLRQFLLKRSLTLAECLDICISIAQGLAAAHQAGIVHRDLKPENVMITESGGTKILDFGLAKIRRQPAACAAATAETVSVAVSTTGFVVGTVNYMSPEQLEGQTVDPRSDIFSFGILLYELVSGRHPFAGRSPLSTIGNILREEPVSPAQWCSGMPGELEHVIQKCLRKPAEERYQSTADLLADLQNVRRILASGVKAAVALPDEEFAMPRGTARALLLVIQLGYLALYVAALHFAEAIETKFPVSLLSWGAMPLVVVLALCGIAVRLYLLAAVGLDHPATGKQFRRLFPALLFLDALWAVAPLLLSHKIGPWMALGCTAALAYLPFSQRTLIQCAYHPTAARRSSGQRPASGSGTEQK